MIDSAQEGKKYRVIGNEGDIIHFFAVGTIVVLESTDEDGPLFQEVEDSGLCQYIAFVDLEEVA